MAHFAEIDENSFVVRVLVTDNDDPNGDEGLKWLEDNLGGTWLKCSYNTRAGVHITGGTPFRKNFPSEGWQYSKSRDAFVPKKPYPSWILNEETCLWEAPVPFPTDGKNYLWDEFDEKWIKAVPGMDLNMQPLD